MNFLRKPPVIALIIVLVTVVWVVSGQFGGEPETTEVDDNTDEQTLIVEAEWRQAETITSYISLQGALEPNREVVLKAETSGRVIELLAARGEQVEEGSPLVRLATEDREIQLERARLQVEEAQRQFDAVARLQSRELGSQTEVDAARTALKLAEVELRQAELNVERTLISAPFDAILEERRVELGDYLTIGAEVLRLLDNDPLVVNVQVPQTEIGFVEMGEEAAVRLIGGAELSGQVRYIAGRARPETRTFRVEIEVPNGKGVRVGSSATAMIPRGNVEAHFISSALLSLNDDGTMGVKSIKEDGSVAFHAAAIERSSTEGVWVSGLPARVRLITSGQGFARVGETVRIASDEASRSDSQLSLSGPSKEAN